MTRLDKSKPYGELHGGYGPARFEQGGNLYDFHGNPIGMWVPAEEKEAPPPKVDQNDMILQLHNEGLSNGDIAKRLGIHHFTVKAILKRVL